MSGKLALQAACSAGPADQPDLSIGVNDSRAKKTIDERWPSPVALRLITNRTLPGGRLS